MSPRLACLPFMGSILQKGVVVLLQVACESATKTGMVMIFGEITTKAKVDYEKVRGRRETLPKGMLLEGPVLMGSCLQRVMSLFLGWYQAVR